MKLSKALSIVLFVITSCLVTAVPARAFDDEAKSQIIPVVTVAPNLFLAGQPSDTFVCVSNGNPSSTKFIQAGDVFKLTFDPSIGAVATVVSAVMVNSSNLQAADFSASLGSEPNQIVISYIGESKRFMPGDSFCVKVNFTANNAIGSGKITGDASASGGEPGRYNDVDPKYTTISIVDFATGPPGMKGDKGEKGDTGPQGSGSVTEVSASSPLVVTNPTTTPNIALGVVPAVNGGTGLSSPGVEANFLRSDGAGAWRSAPLTVTDIPAGSANYIHNSVVPQPAANFNITGAGAANVFNATTQYNIAGNRILSNPGLNNLFVGVNAGSSNASGNHNAFVGLAAGNKNSNGVNNAFFGASAGRESVSGSSNTFLGFGAGFQNSTGSNNVFIGSLAGNPNPTTQVNNSVAIGANVTVSASNTIVLGRNIHTTTIPGKLVLGASSPIVSGGGGFVETVNVNGVSGIFTGNIVISDLFRPLASTIRVCARTQFLPPGTGGYILSSCASSLSSVSNKTDVQPFSGGLDLINRLKPVAFNWKADGSRDFGLNAEDVAEVEPALVTRNDKGEIEDVKEGMLTVVLINALKEQQRQIQAQQEQIAQQQQQIDALKQLVSNMRANRPVR
ncbi:MAG TPA: tail fiber domain-containing protein [Blastocatellia bacterium]|nr:tail fiber domain-containing protein [Blastocatellia bacterium]